MALSISTALLDAIRDAARAAGACECCGLLVGDVAGIVTSIIPADNVSPTPENRFEIDPALLLRAYRAARQGGPAIIGHYHSHPGGDPVPSSTDAAMAERRGEIWLIVGRDGVVRAWRAGPTGALHGCFDAVEIIDLAQDRLAPASPDRH